MFGLCFCLEYLEGGCLTGQSRFTFVVFEYIANVSLISVCRAQLHTIMISPCSAQRVGGALAVNNYYFTMATQYSQMTDRKRTRTDILTTSLDSAPICSWPRFLLIKGTENERPLSKLSPFGLNTAIVAVLGSDPFNIKKLRYEEILIEVDREAQSSKLLKMAKLNLTMDNVIPITVSPPYSLNTKKGVIRCPDIKEGVIKLDRISVFRDGQRKPTETFILTFQRQTLPRMHDRSEMCELPRKPCL